MEKYKVEKTELWYVCLSDAEKCPTGYKGYVFPDDGFVNNIDYVSNQLHSEMIVIPKWLNSDEDITDTEQYFKKIRLELIDILSDELNQFHATGYSNDEWKIVLAEWLCYYIPQCYDKYIRLKKIKDLGLQCSCEVFDTSKICPPFDYSDYIRSITISESYNKYLYSEIISLCQFDEWLTVEKCGIYKHHVRTNSWNNKVLVKSCVYDTAFKLAHFLTRKNDKVVIHGSFLPNDFLMDISAKHLGDITNYLAISRYGNNVGEISDLFRKKTAVGKCDDEFVQLIKKTLLADIPVAYLEGYKNIRRKARRIYKFGYKDVKSVVFSSSGVCSDEIFKIYLMDLKHTKKCNYYVTQHGGNYGIDKMELDDVETELADYQYTWGWKKKHSSNCECIPMPAAILLNRPLNSLLNGDGKILLIDYSYPRHLSIFCREANHYSYDLEREMQFLSELSENVKKKLVIRLFPDDYGWHIKEKINNRTIGLRFDDEPSFYNSIMSADLCVLTGCSTTIIEVMHANRPCIVYRRNGLLEDCAVEAIAFLEKVGIICNDWDSLLDQVENVSQNIQEWWGDEERQKAVKKFCNLFAYMPDEPKKQWCEEIERLM